MNILCVIPVRGGSKGVPRKNVRSVAGRPLVVWTIEQALAARPAALAVDLSACTFVDASALAVLLDVHRRTSRTGGVLTLVGCCPRVLRLLSLTGLRRVFALA